MGGLEVCRQLAAQSKGFVCLVLLLLLGCKLNSFTFTKQIRGFSVFFNLKSCVHPFFITDRDNIVLELIIGRPQVHLSCFDSWVYQHVDIEIEHLPRPWAS
jgi:hypothetical protein